MRVEGWEICLIGYLDERQSMPFQWGWQDCCCFSCGGIAVQGFRNPMFGLKKYKTQRGAAGTIRRLGGTLDEAATTLADKVGLREIDPVFAGRGCPVLAEIKTPWDSIESALGLIGIDGSSALFAGRDGLVNYPLSECCRAWGFN